jgi:hypothetical protein
MIPNKTSPKKDSAQDECFGRLCRQRVRRQANSDAQAGASKNKPHQEKKPLFSILAIIEGNETKHQQWAGNQDTITQPDAKTRAPSQRLSARAMGAMGAKK